LKYEINLLNKKGFVSLVKKSMALYKSLEYLKQIDKAIYKKKTGSPGALAESIGVSERQLYRYLDVIRKMGAPITFDEVKRTYYYSKHKRIFIEIGVKKF
jgi:predicted DNA-binding transcriptional regulator YafY